ncbi:MAG: hypothetical protein M1827_007403 [Pycnora praestabilis]|nr:MAG: hypothetical protein M1827_007403 [Pycnora praestabilis]
MLLSIGLLASLATTLLACPLPLHTRPKTLVKQIPQGDSPVHTLNDGPSSERLLPFTLSALSDSTVFGDEDEDLTALPTPIDPCERPLATTILMQLSAHRNDKGDEETEGWRSIPLSTLERERQLLRSCQQRIEEQKESGRRRYCADIMIIGLVCLFLVVVFTVEILEKVFRSALCRALAAQGTIRLNGEEKLLRSPPSSPSLPPSYLDEKVRLGPWDSIDD